MEKFTNSRFNCLMECPRKERNQYQRGYRLVQEDDAALNFGTAFHGCLEAYGRRKMGQPTQEPDLSMLDAYERAKVTALLDCHIVRWENEPETYLHVESEWEAPLVHPITGEVHPRVMLGGKIDGIVSVGGKTYILEYKTSSEDISEGSTYWARKRLDTQVSLYHIGARVLGHDVDGCIYDVSRKPALRPKKANKTNKTDETPEEFEERVRQDIASDIDAYFKRAVIVRSQTEIDRTIMDLWDTVSLWESGIQMGAFPRNVGSCFKWGKPCVFWSDCCGDSVLEEDTRFHIVGPHPELNNSSKEAA